MNWHFSEWCYHWNVSHIHQKCVLEAYPTIHFCWTADLALLGQRNIYGALSLSVTHKSTKIYYGQTEKIWNNHMLLLVVQNKSLFCFKSFLQLRKNTVKFASCYAEKVDMFDPFLKPLFFPKIKVSRSTRTFVWT